MADIRINALATTATASASDDYIAIDGAANGTRKLSAYTPAFGVVKIGTGIANYAEFSYSSFYGTTDYALTQNPSGATLLNAALGQDVTIRSNRNVLAATFTNGNTTLAGNLTVSGTGTGITLAPASGAATLALNGPAAGSAIQFQLTGTAKYTAEYVNGSDFFAIGRSGVAYDLVLKSGNLLVGTTTDSSNGKLQLATHTTSAGGIGFGTDLSQYRINSTTMGINGAGSSLTFGIYLGGVQKGTLGCDSTSTYLANQVAGGSLVLLSGAATTALTLDSSQRTILSGALRLNNAYTAGVVVQTGYVTIQDSNGNTYKVLCAP